MNNLKTKEQKREQLLQHIVMNKPDLIVKRAQTQYSIKNLQGRSVRLDVYAEDSNDKKYNVEVQRTDRGAGARRARYNSSLIDANTILPGDDIKELPETYVILITENDVLGKGRPLYHINRVIEETGDSFGDGSYIIYVNGAYRDDTPLGKLMHDFSCSNPADMNYKILADRTRYFKEDKEGLESMCKVVEDLIHEEVKESNIAIAMRMLERGRMSIEEIAEDVGLSAEEVKKISDELKHPDV